MTDYVRNKGKQSASDYVRIPDVTLQSITYVTYRGNLCCVRNRNGTAENRAKNKKAVQSKIIDSGCTVLDSAVRGAFIRLNGSKNWCLFVVNKNLAKTKKDCWCRQKWLIFDRSNQSGH